MAYKAFVSSTFEDLKEHRKAVIASLRKAGIFVDPMEDWTAASDEPKKFSQDRVKNCDLCVLLVAFRRGHVPEGEELSITQLEYQAAVNSEIDILVFMLKEDSLWLPKFYELDKDPPSRLFRAQLEKSKGVSFFDHNPGSIDIAPAVARWISEKQELFGSVSLPLAPASSEWPAHVVEHLSTQLNDEFAFHMQAGEDLSSDQAGARYIQGVLKLRDRQGDASAPAKSHDSRHGMEGPLEDFLAADGVQLLVIGAGGSGKTTMLKHLAADGARRAVQDPRAPIFVYLRLASFDHGDGGFDLLLDRLSTAAHLDRKEFEVRWREGRRPMVLLLDGLNEVARDYQPSCTQALLTVLHNSHLLHRYVITSRPGGEFEAMSRRSLENKRLRLADVLEFGPQQVQEYLKAQGRTELLSRISERLQALSSNPFLLWALTRTLATSHAGEPKNRGSLYSALIDRYIFEERERSKAMPRPTDYNYELVKKPVLAQLALKMTEDGATVVPDALGLWQQVGKHLQAMEQQREQDRALPLKAEVFMPKDYEAVSFLRETVDNGVLVRDGNSLRFMHESVQEYFAAVALGTSTVEDLVRRVPSLKLARLDTRGPMFETLVTWAGLTSLEKVTAVVERLQDKHPLLAAHLAVEAGLPDEALQELRHQFLFNTASEHEQRQKLGARGLAVAPSQEPAVVARLIEMLDDVYDLRTIATQALKAMPTKGILSALVKAWTTSSKDVGSEEAELLRELAVEHSGPVAEVLLDAWRAVDSRRDRVAELAAFLDAKEGWEDDQRSVVRETLLTLSVEAELEGNLQRSADLDALRQRAEHTVVQSLSRVARAGKQLRETLDWRAAWDREYEKLAPIYIEKDDAVLEGLARDGEPFQREVALDTLVGRGAPAAVALLVESVLSDPQEKWLDALESLPRQPVQRYLATRIETLHGERLRRARLLAGLLADEPPRAVLAAVFQDASEQLRVFAVRAAVRAGTEGVELLIEQLSNEASGNVLEACVRALGESRNPAALTHLLDLLFEPAARRHWPYGSEDLVSDEEDGRGRSGDGGAALIHNALADAGVAERTLEHLQRHLRSRRPGAAYAAIHEARRWLPAPWALELLDRAMADTDVDVRLWAQWSLACTGHATAWRALLQTELETPPDYVGLAQDAARRLGTTATEPATRDPLIAASQAVLRAALADSDEKRRARALELTRRLPAQWVEAAWHREALATAELLYQSVEMDQRVQAVRALHRFAEDGDDRIFTILMNDSDEAVTRCAYNMLGDGAAVRLEERLQTALRVGDAAATRHIAGLVGTLLRYSEKLDTIRDSAGTWLDTGNRDQGVAALLALAMLYSEYGAGEAWVELSKRARAAFHHHGLEEMWRQFAVYAQALSESGRKFIYMVFKAFAEELEQFALLVGWAEELWPDDPELLAYCIEVALRRGDRAQAVERIAVIQERFDDQINPGWLAYQFVELDRPHDALRYYRIMVERNPTNDVAHFLVGWYAFETGDLQGSIEATQRSLKLQPTSAGSEFNLGLALLARRDTVAAEAAYRRGGALTRRQAPADARQVLEAALEGFTLLPALPDATKDAVDRIRTCLQGERDRLGTG